MMVVGNLEKDLVWEWESFLTLEKVVEVVMEVVEVEFAPVLLQEFAMELEWDDVMLLQFQWVEIMRVLHPLLHHYQSSSNSRDLL